MSLWNHLARQLVFMHIAAWLIGALVCASSAKPVRADWTLEDMITENSRGEIEFQSMPMEERYRNPWPEKLESEFRSRARRVIDAHSNIPYRGSTYFENEKRWYGYAMSNILAGNAKIALAALQETDHQHETWHRETDGIDYYACFTLKHQIRKYFYFGDILDHDYRRTMFSGAQKWTSADPLRRPHYAFDSEASGWGPNAKNSWVDVRSTDNLFLMRTTSVYLMAEETGNAQTAILYKRILLDYLATLYRVGLGEWDSENYLGHSIAPVFNLYDFAQDGEVRLAAKAMLDWFYAAGAVKYYRGAFNGPTKRDYNHPQPFGGSAASMLWLHFGDTPIDPEEWESDEVHAITSNYRPPMAVVELARGQLEKPLEIYSSKPPYSATTSMNREAKPAYLETQFISHSYKMGSLASGTETGRGDTNGFKIVLFDDTKGAVAVQAAPTDNPAFPGSPAYQDGIVTAENRVAQFENLAIWITKEPSGWVWVIPDGIAVSDDDGVICLECDRTRIAIFSINLPMLELDRDKTQLVALPRGDKKAKFPRHRVLATQSIQPYSGFGIYIAESHHHEDMSAFKAALKMSHLDVDAVEQGQVSFRCEGKTVSLVWSEDPRKMVVLRNGVQHDWEDHAKSIYRQANRKEGAISSAWGEGKLRVESENHIFECVVDDKGAVAFANHVK